jgi:hypothetical protein
MIPILSPVANKMKRGCKDFAFCRRPLKEPMRRPGGRGGGVKRAEGLSVFAFVACEEFVPAVVDELPEWCGPGAAGLVDERHKEGP